VPVTDAVRYLAEIPSPTESVWYLGPLPIRAYALCILAGIVAASAIAEVRLRRRGAPKWLVLDIAIWAVPFGIVGGRIYHVITSPDKYFGTGGEPLDAFAIWEGGLGIWGAIALGGVGAWIACRNRGIPLTFFADALAPGLPVAQAIGRLGNWFNNELYGGPTSLPWGLKIYESDPRTRNARIDEFGNPTELPGGPFHPTFLYELVWDLGVAALVWLVDRRWKLGKGRALALYVMAYCVGRFWIEALRIDPAHELLGMRVNNWVSILVFLGALVYFLRVRGPQEHVRVGEDGTLHLVTAEGEPIEWRRKRAAGGPSPLGEAGAGKSDDGSAGGEAGEVSRDGPPEKSTVDISASPVDASNADDAASVEKK
jgi:prolipoprotein diacylglyceryl transferase